MRGGKGLYVVIGVVLVIFIVSQIFGPRPMNWKPSYSRQHTYPFGGRIIFDQLPRIFPNQEIEQVDVSAKQFYNHNWDTTANYIIIQEVFETDYSEAGALLAWVRKGNSLFISANSFIGAFADSLSLITSMNVKEESWLYSRYEPHDSVQLETGVDSLDKRYGFYKGLTAPFLVDYRRGEIIGRDNDLNINFLRRKFGKGEIFIHTAPLVFTNFNLLHSNNYEYAAAALSFLPLSKVYWDEYYKPGRARIQTQLKYVLEERALRWAWLITLGAVVQFIIFDGKRRQRVIPVVTLPKNDSLEFTETIGRLYYERGNHKDIASKKIRFLLDHIRARFYLQTREITEDFLDKLTIKSGVPKAEVFELFRIINAVDLNNVVSEALLMQLNRAIDMFYAKSK